MTRRIALRPLGATLLLGTALMSVACGPGRRSVDLALLDPGRLTATELAELPRRLGSCRPERLGRPDTLVLRMSVPHPDELAVVSPDQTWIYVVHSFDVFGPSLMPPAEFAERERVELPVSDARGLHFVAGHDTLEPIFTASGRYEVKVVDQLSTDVPQPIYGCVVVLGP